MCAIVYRGCVGLRGWDCACARLCVRLCGEIVSV